MESTSDTVKSQQFFATIAAEIRRPGTGDYYRDVMRSLLVRAETAGLYNPQQEQPK